MSSRELGLYSKGYEEMVNVSKLENDSLRKIL